MGMRRIQMLLLIVLFALIFVITLTRAVFAEDRRAA